MLLFPSHDPPVTHEDRVYLTCILLNTTNNILATIIGHVVDDQMKLRAATIHTLTSIFTETFNQFNLPQLQAMMDADDSNQFPT